MVTSLLLQICYQTHECTRELAYMFSHIVYLFGVTYLSIKLSCKWRVHGLWKDLQEIPNTTKGMGISMLTTALPAIRLTLMFRETKNKTTIPPGTCATDTLPLSLHNIIHVCNWCIPLLIHPTVSAWLHFKQSRLVCRLSDCSIITMRGLFGQVNSNNNRITVTPCNPFL